VRESYELATKAAYKMETANGQKSVFQMVGAAERLRQPKHVRTRGTDSKLESKMERN